MYTGACARGMIVRVFRITRRIDCTCTAAAAVECRAFWAVMGSGIYASCSMFKCVPYDTCRLLLFAVTLFSERYAVILSCIEGFVHHGGHELCGLTLHIVLRSTTKCVLSFHIFWTSLYPSTDKTSLYVDAPTCVTNTAVPG